jgi:PAS domain S-box-containing protein
VPAAAGERAAAGPPPAAPAGPAREGPPRVSLGATPPPPTSLHRSRVFVTPLAAHQPPPKERWVRDTLVPHLDGHRHLDGWDGIVTDITEQRLLADDLRRTTSMFHTLVAHLPAGVFFVQGPGGQPILINARARQLLGRREDPSAGVAQLAQVYRLYRPDGTPYPPDELPVCQALRRGLTSMRDDIVVHRPDGRQVPLVAWAAPLDLRGHGQPDAAVWVFEDLTALRQAETARRDSEAQLRAVVATMAEGLVVFDRSGTIGECNPAAAVLFGLDPDQLRGRCLWDPHWVRLREDGSPLGPDDLQALFRLRSGQPVRNVVLGIPQVHRADYRLPMEESGAVPRDQDAAICHLQSAICNPVRWVLVNAMPLTQGADGVPDRVVATFADITGYRHALEVLRVSEEKYRGLVESLPLMLLQADRQLRITYVNPAAQALTGYDLAELGEPGAWQALVHPEDRDRVLACQRDAVGGQTARFEARFRAKDGSEKVGYVVLQPRWQAGQVIGTTALVVDMTLQRRLEHELLRAQRLELVGRLASGVAHDFNNLLTVILTLTELAQHNLPADHVVREDLRRIAEAGEQAAGLAGQLLTFSKQRRVVPHRIDLNQVARRTLELLRGSLPPDITVEADLAGEPLPVLADSLQLHQVLMNLCLNARDAMPHGGRLGLRTDAAPAGPPAGPGWVRVAVRDSGHGMDDEVRGRIFEPFFSTKERGTGLGLAVVRQIVESFGGRIEVHTQPGQGSQFVVWLPRAQDDGMTG